ncbi:MAG: hypothetical protein AAGE52_37510 [Myxococcota bacterium]
MTRAAWVGMILGISSCVGDAAGPPRLVFDDPLGLMDVVGDLRLLVFPAEGRGCSADGTVTPEISDAADATFPEAVVDLRFPTDESSSVTLNVGSYVVLVRGRGTDPVSMRTNVIVATGCTPNVMIEDGETREITIELQDVVGTGVCDDGVLSPDEQCEAATGPLPCSACRTESFVAHTTTDGVQSNPGLGWAPGSRFVLSFDAEDRTGPIQVMLRDENGAVIESPTALALDQAIDFDATLPGAQTTSAAASSPARYGVAFGDFSTAMTDGGDILVRFFTPTRSPAAAATRIGAQPGAQTNPDLAMTTDGAAVVVFDDAGATTWAHVAAAATSAGATGSIAGSGPSVAASSTGFIVAAGGGSVQAQRLSAAGAAEGTAIAVSADAASATAVAALPDGRFFVAWESGGTVRGRAFAADGTPATETSDIGSGTAPAATAGTGRFLVAWESGGTVRARLYNGDGALARNRESPPTTDAFTVGSGTAPQAATGGTTGNVAAVAFVSGGDVQTRLFPLP